MFESELVRQQRVMCGGARRNIQTSAHTGHARVTPFAQQHSTSLAVLFHLFPLNTRDWHPFAEGTVRGAARQIGPISLSTSSALGKSWRGECGSSTCAGNGQPPIVTQPKASLSTDIPCFEPLLDSTHLEAVRHRTTPL